MKIVLSWSSGKDSAWALETLRREGIHEIVGLLTTVNEAFDRVSMHAVRKELLLRQAEEAGLPMYEVSIPFPCPNEVYAERMQAMITRLIGEGVEGIAFGDLFLRDIREYRERMLEGSGLSPLFPLWGRDTTALAKEMIDGGLRAVITCVDPKQLDPSFCGRFFDRALLADLPPGVDPCGENGEFHTYCFAGPIFANPIEVKVLDTVERDGFHFTDVIPT